MPQYERDQPNGPWSEWPPPDRGYLLEEPCRYCHQSGGVYFLIDDSPFGRNTAQVVACERCKNTWTVDGHCA